MSITAVTFLQYFCYALFFSLLFPPPNLDLVFSPLGRLCADSVLGFVETAIVLSDDQQFLKD